MDELFYSIADAWNNGISGMMEVSLSNEMIEDSVARVCTFFDIDMPANIELGSTMAVALGETTIYNDDTQFFNRFQLEEMGITGQDGLDLVMTHEGTHRVLQGLDTDFNKYQEELCCDYMAGVRAGLNGIEVSELEKSLINLPQDSDHPIGEFRVEAFQDGIEFAQNYMESHEMPPAFSDCLDDFKLDDHMHNMAELSRLKDDIFTNECAMNHYQRILDKNPDNGVARIKLDDYTKRYHLAINELDEKTTVIENLRGSASDSVSFENSDDKDLFRNEELSELIDLRDNQENVIHHYQKELEDFVSSNEDIDGYKHILSNCFTERVKYDFLTERIETLSNIDVDKGHNVSFASRDNMRPYDEQSIYDIQHPKLNPFGIYATCHHQGDYPPNDFIEKPDLPNDFTEKQLREVSNAICDAAGIKHIPIFLSSETQNAEFNPGPFRFSTFDDVIYVNPDYAKKCIKEFGNTDSLIIDIAHEIGHELNLMHCGNINSQLNESLADMFSSLIAQKMGIDIDVARQWYMNEMFYDGVGNDDYYPSEKRWDITSAGYYYGHFSTINDYIDALHDKHFLELVRDYETDPVSTMAQKEFDYQIHSHDGIKDNLREVLDKIKNYLFIERL